MDLGARNKPGIDQTRLQREHRRAMGWVTPMLVALLCLGLLLVSYNHVRGNFHRLRTAVIKQDIPAAPVSAGPGGQHAVHLVRSATSLGSTPEFLSVTLLPGRGMQVLQITAVMPAKGEIQLLHAPTLEAATQQLTGTGDDTNGQLGTTFGGAFLAPWAGVLTGSASGTTGQLETNWHGHRLAVPAASDATRRQANVSTEGELLARSTDTVQTGVLADGQWAEARFKAQPANTTWMSSLEMTSRVEMSGHTIDITITGKNNGASPVPAGLGWKPYFAIPSGDRAAARLFVPAASVFATDKRTGLPTGHEQPITNSELYLGRPGGTSIDGMDLDETYTNLQSSIVSDGPAVELQDPGADYGLRMTLLSPTITALHVRTVHPQPWVLIEPDTNASDPFGRQWTTEEGSGIRVLKPGESLTWRVRLELYPLSAGRDSASLP